ncbi:MAG: hypothetical protein B6I20_06810 [Bacteroidetes bacterium 4572_117]|nr:MAG: hypothetical protein B6I20_06810 [Bacteroidetes bacterium 4572_117]
MGKSILSHSRIDEIIINIKTDDFAKEFIKLVDARLEKSYVFHRNIFHRRIDFKGSIFRFAWNGWDLFNTISNGEIEFESKDQKTYISHKIYFTETFTIALLFTLIPITIGGDWPIRLFVFLLIWLSYITTYLISIYRFNSYIAQTLIQVNSKVGYEKKEIIKS